VEEGLVQVADCTALEGLLALEHARQKAYTHDADALLGAQPPRLSAVFTVRRSSCATRHARIFDHWRVLGLHMGQVARAGREMLVMVGQGPVGCW
jgi:hypothetical protein